MYSILIRDEKDATKWSYLLEDEQVWTGTKEEAQTKVQSLLTTTLLSRIKVVHNTTLVAGFTVTDVGE